MGFARILALNFSSVGAIRRRSVSDVVLTGKVDVPVPPKRLFADWERDSRMQLGLEPGEVGALSLARARARWPDYLKCVQAMSDWTRALGLREVLLRSEVALMACRGAKYHHDAEQYGGMAFCNLFLSEDRGLDLHFPHLGHRIPLVRGTAVIFDTGQPHAVIKRSSAGFDVADFLPDRDCTQIFLTWELSIEDANVGRVLRVALDLDPLTSLASDAGQEGLSGALVTVCPESGRWLQGVYQAAAPEKHA
jgi:hypothetical protein